VTVPLWVLPVLLLLPFPVGVLAGYLTAGLLELREVAAIARAHPAGLREDAVPWHLRRHFAPANRGDRLTG
jgi:hypothetical protein